MLIITKKPVFRDIIYSVMQENVDTLPNIMKQKAQNFTNFTNALDVDFIKPNARSL